MLDTPQHRPVTPLGVLLDGRFYWHEALRPHVGRSLRTVRKSGYGPGLSRSTVLVCLDRDWGHICTAAELTDLAAVLAPEPSEPPPSAIDAALAEIDARLDGAPDVSGVRDAIRRVEDRATEPEASERLTPIQAKIHVGRRLEGIGHTYADVAYAFGDMVAGPPGAPGVRLGDLNDAIDFYLRVASRGPSAPARP